MRIPLCRGFFCSSFCHKDTHGSLLFYLFIHFLLFFITEKHSSMSGGEMIVRSSSHTTEGRGTSSPPLPHYLTPEASRCYRCGDGGGEGGTGRVRGRRGTCSWLSPFTLLGSPHLRGTKNYQDGVYDECLKFDCVAIRKRVNFYPGETVITRCEA